MIESTIRDKLFRTADDKKQDMIHFLQDMIRIPSVMVTSEEGKCQAFVGTKLRNLGCDVDIWETEWETLRNAKSPKTGKPLYVPVENWIPEYQGFKDRPNVVGVLKGSGEGRSLLLNGHVDVVPPGPAGVWRHGPWSADIENGRMYGRGTVDMKAGVAAMILAMDCVVSAGIKLKGDIILESVIDEETGGNGTLACILRGYRADAGIFTEPTDLEIHTANSGGQYFKVSVKGKLTHLSNSENGVNAIHKAMKIISALEDWETYRTQKGYERYPGHQRYAIPFPMECGAITAGSLTSFEVESPAELCVFAGAYQSMPDESIDKANSDLEKFIMNVASTDPWMRDHPPKVEFIGMTYEGASVDPRHPIVRTLVEASRLCSNAEPKVSVGHSGCDMRLYTNHADTPSVVFGPGDPLLAHAVDEYVSIENYLNAIKVLAMTMVDWCSTA